MVDGAKKDPKGWCKVVKNGAKVLAKHTTDICNLSTKMLYRVPYIII